MKYYTKTADEALKELSSNKKSGLSLSDVAKRQEKYGPNKLEEKKPPSIFKVFFRQFKDLFTIILFIAAFISFFFGEKTDAIVILAALVINIIISVIQEMKAVKTISELKEVVVFKAKVLRDGAVKEIDAKDLVPGDIIYLDAGDRIPADARILDGNRFETKETVLTGESRSENKEFDAVLDEDTPLGDRKNMVYQSTVVTNGKALAVVTTTGAHTEVGQIAELVEETKEESTPLQKRMAELSIWISIVVIICCIIVFVTGILLKRDIHEMFDFAVVLAVSSIPEGMVISVTIILAVGMRQILKKKAIVRELVAAETLGSTTVICTDKTGTITTGEMEAEKLVTVDGEYPVSDIPKDQIESDKVFYYSFLVSALCNDLIVEDADGACEKALGDTTEKALFDLAGKYDLSKCVLEKQFELIDEIPFDSYIKYMVTAHKDKEDDDRVLVLEKGTAERVLTYSTHIYKGGERVSISEEDRSIIGEKNKELSTKGFRVIALGYKEVDVDDDEEEFDLSKDKGQNLTFLSLIAIRDPIRKNIKEAIEATYAAGVGVKMITGDHKMTARNIANEVGLTVQSDDEVIDGAEFESIQDDEEKLRERVEKAKVFARVAPVHKLKIVEVLQKDNQVVAMTGDGVNDGPALKRADIGVAMGSGTEVAQQTSNMILINDNFKTIVAAVEEGRRIFDNIRKVVLYLLSDSFSELILIFGALVLGLPVPLLPTQILWINLVDDGFPGMALAFDPVDKEAMKEPPRAKNEPVINREMKVLIGIIGAVTGLGTLALFYVLYTIMGMDLAEVRTICFSFLAFDSLLYVFSVRSLRHTLFHEKFFSNKWLLVAVFGGFALQILAVYFGPLQRLFKTVPLSFYDWMVVLIGSIVVIVVIEVVKWIFIARIRKIQKKEA
ncbi:cation-transporting P-type ATPase [Patescibacteria group bacterium]|nr:cation-transporting P-type ATPase [Patescibacteria group bacterium]